MNLFVQIIVWINAFFNALANFLLDPIAIMPGWLSNTIISAVVGLALMIIFKYTSNQHAIGKVKDNIKANMLALKLFKDSISVTLKAQGHLLKGALLLLVHAIRPMLVMIVPVSMLLVQMGLWYQHQPLFQGEETILTMELNSPLNSAWPDVTIQDNPAVEIVIGPVKVFSKRQLYWKIRARENGYQHITFHVDKQTVKKELAVGDGFMRISSTRPQWHWADIINYPLEKPFPPDSLVRSISIHYPDRLSRTSGTDWWIIYFFIASLAFALVFKPFLKVRI